MKEARSKAGLLLRLCLEDNADFMSDITQIIGTGQVRFSANTPAAATWMRDLYKSTKVVFTLPEDHERAMLFIEYAARRNPVVSSMRERP